MALKVFQNDDLLRHIYGFGDVVHRKQMDMNFYEMETYTLSKVPEQYPYSDPDMDIINDETMHQSLTRFFQLHRCMCCTRHTHNKPQLYLVHWKPEPWMVVGKRIIYSPECKNLHNCFCDCRHKTRILVDRIIERSTLNTIFYN